MTSTDSPTEQDRPLRAGVVGYGWAGRQHMQGYADAAGAELVAICGMETEAAAALSQQYAGVETFTRLEDMLAAAQLDVVSIATPTALHSPLAVTALEAGVHVLSEKPMAENAAAAQAMVDAAERNDRVLEVSFNHRRRGVVTALKQAIDDGLLGEIYYAKVGWLRRSGIPGLGTWFTRKDSAGGGPFMDIGVHMVDLGLHLLGEAEPVTVSASTYAKFGPRGLGGSSTYTNATASATAPYDVEDLATAFCRLDTGATMTVEASWAQWIERDLCFADVYGTEAGAHLTWGSTPNGELVITTDVSGRPATITPPIPASTLHSGCVAEFVDVVASGEWSEARGRQALARTRLVDAAYLSAERQREVVLDRA